MPDDWEKAHNLNPEDPKDGNEIGKDGYTHLEIYLNSLVTAKGSTR
jgi:pectate lyase